MGIKDLWTVITPYCERKPLFELQGKVVAIDLAGWVCESLNVVDYFVHSKQHLKNLYFRTCYLLLAGVVPVFVLDGEAPELKKDTISKRNCLQFRGVKPREEQSQSTQPTAAKSKKGRTRFNYVLKECEGLLQAMGLECIQAPGEAEAYCAHLNRGGKVYGIISQDSDCFAYGAIRVFRNFSLSSQGSAAASGGAVDIYDMDKICSAMDFGQNKIIAMALLCGCDYCPGVDGVGKDGVIKLFSKYQNSDILDRIRSWRKNDYKYTELEIKVDDKNICANCGHCGKTVSHTKSGCSSCRTPKGCDSSLWKEERLALKSELALRKKALLLADFPSEEIISEFLTRPESLPNLDLSWKQPNLVRFVKVIGNSLQWTEVYCFQKFLPLLTRWLIFNYGENRPDLPSRGIVRPGYIKKKRNPKGIPSYEIVWKDDDKHFDCLIPDDQLQSYLNENPGGMETLFSTIEPADIFEKSYPTIVEEFMSKQKKPKATKKKGESKRKNIVKEIANDSLNNLCDLLKATEEVEKHLKKPRKKKTKDDNLPKLDQFLTSRSTPIQTKKPNLALSVNCSTPKGACKLLCLSDLEDDTDDFNYSEIIQNIVTKPSELTKFDGKRLKYDSVHYLDRSLDDLDLLPKMKRSFPSESPYKGTKRLMLDNDGDTSVKLSRSQDDINISSHRVVESVVDRFLRRERVSMHKKPEVDTNVSYFFGMSTDGVDEFERSFDMKFDKSDEDSDNLDCVIID